jgi:uncharacterized protein (TIGR00369 family)
MTSSDASKQQALLQQLSAAFTAIPFNKMLGLQLDHINADHVIMTFPMKDELIGNFLHGILHGGVISSVLDMAGGMATMSAALHKNIDLPMEELVNIVGRTSTVDLQVSYLRPGRGEFFTAHGWLTKSGRKISFAQMELKNQEEILIATASATYLLK